MSRVQRIAKYAIGLAGLRKEDVLLSSFPRSGNTWMRFIFCNLISLLDWRGMAVDFSVLNATMPELGASSLLKPWKTSAVPRIVKTHHNYQPLFGRNRSIGIVRDPRDVMVSYYHYRKDRKGSYDGSFGEFIRDGYAGLEGWFEHYLSWHHRWTLVVSYEEMKQEPLLEFSRVLEMLGVTYPEATLREAIQRSSLQKVQQAEKDTSILKAEKAIFARHGGVRQWRVYFTEQDRMYYDGLVKRYGLDIYCDD